MTEIEPGELHDTSFWQGMIERKGLYVGKIITLPDKKERWKITTIDDCLGILNLVGVDNPSDFMTYFIDQVP